MESTVTFNSLCVFVSMMEHDLPRLSEITKIDSKLISVPVTDIQSHFEARAVKRLRIIPAVLVFDLVTLNRQPDGIPSYEWLVDGPNLCKGLVETTTYSLLGQKQTGSRKHS